MRVLRYGVNFVETLEYQEQYTTLKGRRPRFDRCDGVLVVGAQVLGVVVVKVRS